MNEKIEKLRKRIDALDDRLLSLLNERAEMSKQVGQLKGAAQETFFTPERESEIHRRLASKNPGPLSKEQLQTLFREIISASRSLAKPPRAVYWGPPGSYSEQAAKLAFGAWSELSAVDDLDEAFAKVETRQADYAVLPIENSIAGVVVESLDRLLRTTANLCGEIYLPISHALVSKETNLAKVKAVYVGPQPKAQCRRWLEANLPSAELIDCSPSSRAAQMAAEKNGAAAIASAEAAKLYGLNVLAIGIESHENNTTRFLILGFNQPRPTGKDKTALLFAVKDRPGQLYRALGAFNKRKLNLTMIESRPHPRKPFAYMFYVEIQGHRDDAALAEAIEALERYAADVQPLGSFPEAMV